VTFLCRQFAKDHFAKDHVMRGVRARCGFCILLVIFAAATCYSHRSLAESQSDRMELTLKDAVHLAVRKNRNIESAYLNRILQRYSLSREIASFQPQFVITPQVGISSARSSTRYQDEGLDRNLSQTEAVNAGVLATVTQPLTSGGEISFGWDNRFQRINNHDSNEYTESGVSGWRASYRQPLLKGAGVEYNTASLRRAHLQEEDNVRGLRDQLIQLISQVIQRYWSLHEAQADIDVQKDALDKAREQHEITMMQIETGRKAPNEMLQSETNLARQELAYEESKARRDETLLSLLRLLELDSVREIIPVEEIAFTPYSPDFDECIEPI
jgi:outer membrane protein TolC